MTTVLKTNAKARGNWTDYFCLIKSSIFVSTFLSITKFQIQTFIGLVAQTYSATKKIKYIWQY